MLFRLICIALVITVSAGIGRAANSDTSDREHPPLPGAEKASISQIDYLLQPYDLIEVVIFQEADLERQVRLSDDSRVTLPLIGTVDLKNQSIGNAQKIVHDLYEKDYLVNPQINITVLEYAKETVNVLGSVNSPGAILIPPDQALNLVDAITRAGGFSRLADRKRVKLSRLNGDGGATTTIINVDDIIQSTTQHAWKLQKGDVIYVPERIL